MIWKMPNNLMQLLLKAVFNFSFTIISKILSSVLKVSYIYNCHRYTNSVEMHHNGSTKSMFGHDTWGFPSNGWQGRCHRSFFLLCFSHGPRSWILKRWEEVSCVHRYYLPLPHVSSQPWRQSSRHFNGFLEDNVKIILLASRYWG